MRTVSCALSIKVVDVVMGSLQQHPGYVSGLKI